MIVRMGGGNSGIGKYLEEGLKHGRHFGRDELDTRIVIDGDLDVTNLIIESIENKGQERYLHLSLSFDEPDITPEKMTRAYETYKETFLQAYKPDELNVYAEIHWPKIQQAPNRKTGELEKRYPHIHLVIPKQNLLSGKYANPSGLHERNVGTWDAIQEYTIRKHGLNSPSDSPRVSLENYSKVLDRHKEKEFKRSEVGQIKKNIFESVESADCKSWEDFKAIVAEHGDVIVRNEGKDNEYLAFRREGNKKFTNLNNPVFSKQFIESREIPHEPLTDYQIKNRLDRWSQKSRELKYIQDSSRQTKEHYNSLSDFEKTKYLNDIESAFYEQHEVPEREPEQKPHRPSDFKAVRGIAAEKRSLHELQPLNLVHDKPSRHIVPRADLLLHSNVSNELPVNQADRDTGLHRALYDGGRIKSHTQQIIFDLQEADQLSKESELELFREIRRELEPELLLAYAQANNLLEPESHKITYAKDGSPRISFGAYNYNVSDFLTKGIGLEWSEAKDILTSLYETQNSGIIIKPKPNNEIANSIAKFDTIYLDKLAEHRSETNRLNKRRYEELKAIRDSYYQNLRSIRFSGKSYAEKNKERSLQTFYKLVAEEEILAGFAAKERELNKQVYPFTNQFKTYLKETGVVDVSYIDDLKKKIEMINEEQEGDFIVSGKSASFVMDGKEAAARAKLMAEMDKSGKPHKDYGYSFKDLTPQQKKDSVVFSHGSEKLFEAMPDRTKLAGRPTPDKVATALNYSLARYGNPLDIKGSETFKDTLIDVAARTGVEVEFTDPVLNEKLAERKLEIANGLENAENAIAPASLELDSNLPQAEAVDKALLESKQREIVENIEQISFEEIELSAISIEQRDRVHKSEPSTAETAELDAQLFKELDDNPAMQAHFAQKMAAQAVEHQSYNNALADLGIQSDVQLAAHGGLAELNNHKDFMRDIQAVEDRNYVSIEKLIKDIDNGAGLDAGLSAELAERTTEAVTFLKLQDPDGAAIGLKETSNFDAVHNIEKAAEGLAEKSENFKAALEASQATLPQPIENLDKVDERLAFVINSQITMGKFDSVEFDIAKPVHIDTDHTLEAGGTVELKSLPNDNWAVSFSEENYYFETDSLEQATKNFVFIAQAKDSLVASDLLSDDNKATIILNELEKNGGKLDGFKLAEEGAKVNQAMDSYIEQKEADNAGLSFSEQVQAAQEAFDNAGLNGLNINFDEELIKEKTPAQKLIQSTMSDLDFVANVRRLPEGFTGEGLAEKLKELNKHLESGELSGEKWQGKPLLQELDKALEKATARAPQLAEALEQAGYERAEPVEPAHSDEKIVNFTARNDLYEYDLAADTVQGMIEKIEKNDHGMNRFNVNFENGESMQIIRSEDNPNEWVRDDGQTYKNELAEVKQELIDFVESDDTSKLGVFIRNDDANLINLEKQPDGKLVYSNSNIHLSAEDMGTVVEFEQGETEKAIDHLIKDVASLSDSDAADKNTSDLLKRELGIERENLAFEQGFISDDLRAELISDMQSGTIDELTVPMGDSNQTEFKLYKQEDGAWKAERSNAYLTAEAMAEDANLKSYSPDEAIDWMIDDIHNMPEKSDGLTPQSALREQLNAAKELSMQQFIEQNPDDAERVRTAALEMKPIDELNHDVKTDPTAVDDLEKSFKDEAKTKFVLNLYNDTLTAINTDNPNAIKAQSELVSVATKKMNEIKENGLSSGKNKHKMDAATDYRKKQDSTLNPSNIEHRAKANKLQAYKAPNDKKEAETLAKKAVDTIIGLRGRPEVSTAAAYVAGMAESNSDFKEAFDSAAGSNPYVSAVVETATRQPEPTQTMSKSEMEM